MNRLLSQKVVFSAWIRYCVNTLQRDYVIAGKRYSVTTLLRENVIACIETWREVLVISTHMMYNTVVMVYFMFFRPIKNLLISWHWGDASYLKINLRGKCWPQYLSWKLVLITLFVIRLVLYLDHECQAKLMFSPFLRSFQ